jgi:hypothetical protein
VNDRGTSARVRYGEPPTAVCAVARRSGTAAAAEAASDADNAVAIASALVGTWHAAGRDRAVCAGIAGHRVGRLRHERAFVIEDLERREQENLIVVVEVLRVLAQPLDLSRQRPLSCLRLRQQIVCTLPRVGDDSLGMLLRFATDVGRRALRGHERVGDGVLAIACFLELFLALLERALQAVALVPDDLVTVGYVRQQLVDLCLVVAASGAALRCDRTYLTRSQEGISVHKMIVRSVRKAPNYALTIHDSPVPPVRAVRCRG